MQSTQFRVRHGIIVETSNNTSTAIVANNQVLTGSASNALVDLATTWNTLGNPTAIKLNVTNTASGANSALMELLVGGNSFFKIDKTGNISIKQGAGAYEGMTINQSYDTTTFGSTTGSFRRFLFSSAVAFGVSNIHTQIRGDSLLGWTTNSNVLGTYDVVLARDISISNTSFTGLLGQRNGVNPQTYRVYGTYTDESNYERLSLSANSTGQYVRGEEGGTGLPRPLFLGSNNATHMTVTAAGNIGIGTTNPTTGMKFDVVGSSRFEKWIHVDRLGGNLSSYFYIVSRSADEAGNFNNVAGNGQIELASVGTSMIVGSTGYSPLVLATTSLERMRIIANGNIGIGISTPNYKLHVNGDIGIHDAGSLRLLQSNTEVGRLTTNAGELALVGAAASAFLSFYTNAGAGVVERMRIAANGNVGIGTSSPSEKLVLRGSAGSNIIKLSLQNGDGTELVSVGSGSDAIANFQSYGAMRIKSAIVPATLGPIYLNAGNTDVVTVAANGNVGIGTTSPVTTLFTNGIVSSMGSLRIYNPANTSRYMYIDYTEHLHPVWNFVNSGGGGVIHFQSNGTDSVLITTGGSVNQPAIDSGGVSAGKFLNASGGIFAGTDVLVGGAGIFSSLGGQNVGLKTSSVTRFYVSPAGNIAIGMGSINATVRLAMADGTSPTSQHIYGTYTDTSNYERVNFTANSTGHYVLGEEAGTGSPRPLYLGANNTTHMTVAANGNVGIGVTTPVSKTEIFTGIGTGAAGTANNFTLRSSETNGNAMVLNLGVSNLSKGGQNQGHGYIQATYWGGSADNPLLLQPLGGGVLVGDNTTHDWKMTVRGTLALAANTNTAGSYGGRLAFPSQNYAGETAWIASIFDTAGFAGGTGLAFGTISGADVASSDGVERVRISSNGNVGIGTSSPAYNLDIASSETSLRVRGAFDSSLIFSNYRVTYSAGGLNGFDNGAGLILSSTNATKSPLIQFVNGGEGINASSVITVDNVSTMNFVVGSYDTMYLRKGDNRPGSAIFGGLAADKTYNNASLLSRGRWEGAPAAIFAKRNSSTTADIVRVQDETLTNTYFMVSANGNVGINTNEPKALLAIRNTGSINSYMTGLDLVSSAVSSGQYIPAIQFAYTDGYAFSAINALRQGTLGGSLVFHTAPSTGAIVERMRIDNAGNIGIGTSSPSARLTVYNTEDNWNSILSRNTGNVTPSNGILLLESRTTTGSGNTTNAFIEILATNGSNSRTVRFGLGIPNTFGTHDTGFITLGTGNMWNPQSGVFKWSTTGTTVGSGSNQYKGYEWYNNQSDNQNAFWFYHDITAGAGSTFKIYSAKTSNTNTAVLDVTSASGALFVVDNTGKVGIGTASPTKLLQVNGTTRLNWSATTATPIFDNVGVQIAVEHNQGTTYLTSNTNATINFADLLTPTERLAAITYASKNININNVVSDGNIILSANNTERMRIAANGNIGIGTSSPAQTLRVNGTFASGNSYSIIVNDDPIGFGRFYLTGDLVAGLAVNPQASARDWGFGITSLPALSANFVLTNTYGYDPGWSYNIISVGGLNIVVNKANTAMTFAANGNVGIGTTNTTAKLTVANGTSPTSQHIYGTYTDVSNYERINLTANSSGHYILGEEAGSGLPRPLYLGANNSTMVTVAANGNVGIGTVSPAGYLWAPAAADNAQARIGQIIFNSSQVAGYTGSILWANWNPLTAAKNVVGWSYGLDLGRSGDFLAISRIPDGSTTASEFLRINSSGNVGIGITTPTYKLDVAGPVSFPYNIASFTDGTSRGITLKSSTNGYTNMRLFDAGGRNITITSQPNDLTTADNYLAAIASGLGAGVSLSTAVNVDSQHITLRARGDIAFYTNLGSTALLERMRITSGGNVGIGTSNPSVKLHVVYDGTDVNGTPGQYISGADRGSFAGFAATATGGKTWAIGSTSDTHSAGGGKFALTLLDTNSTKLVVNADGDLGINTTTPTAKLDVNSDTIRIRTAKTPASATAAGNQGDICWDGSYIYVCTATNTWVRASLATW